MQYRGNVLLWPKSDESKKSLVLFYLFTLWARGRGGGVGGINRTIMISHTIGNVI